MLPCATQGVQGISDIITIPGLVNVDFADVKAIMCNSGTAMLGVGVATGKGRAEEAALVRARLLICERKAVLGCTGFALASWLRAWEGSSRPPVWEVPRSADICSARTWLNLKATCCMAAQAATSAPLIERSIERATGIVYNITGGKDLTLQEVNRVSEVVTSLADPSANVIFGAVIEDQYEGEVHVTIIATGFSQSFEEGLLQGKTPVRPPLPSLGKPWNSVLGRTCCGARRRCPCLPLAEPPPLM